MSSNSNANSLNTSGAAGGSGNDTGADFAASVASWAAVNMLAQHADLPWNLPADSQIVNLACQCVTEVDDIVLTLSGGGHVYLQAKHRLQLNSEFDKAIGQMVRAFHSPTFVHLQDRLVIVTNHAAANIIRLELKRIVECCSLPDFTPGELQKLTAGFISKKEKDVYGKLRDKIESHWLKIKPLIDDSEYCAFLMHLNIFVFDPHKDDSAKHCAERIRRDLNSDKPAAVWGVINNIMLKASADRKSYDRNNLLHDLSNMKLINTVTRCEESVLRQAVIALTQHSLTSGYATQLNQSGIYLERTTLDAETAKFIGGNKKVLIFSGESGKGKTSWCLHYTHHNDIDDCLLVSGDDFSGADNSLYASLSRLICSHAVSPLKDLPQNEVISWLKQQGMTIILDGLDRVPAGLTQRLSLWFERTLGELASGNNKLIITSRPETLEGLNSFSGNALIYNTQNKLSVAVEDFTALEARELAIMLGKEHLEKYRRPAMMVYCSKFDSAAEHEKLSSFQIISEYTDFLISGMIGRSGLFADRVKFYLAHVGRALAASASGVLSEQKAWELMKEDPECFEAFKRNNLLTGKNEWLRVEPDQVSEFLQGKYIDVADAIARLDEICAIPLKLGALRSRLQQEARIQPDTIMSWLQQMIAHWKRKRQDELLTTLCEVLASLQHPEQGLPFMTELAREWNRHNLEMIVSPGRDLLELLNHRRFSLAQRRHNLWLLAVKEEGYDWRPKHWLTPDYAPNFFETTWKEAMLACIAEDKQSGFAFLLQYFTDTTAFADTNEAVLGDLARGLFYLSSEHDVIAALEFLKKHNQFSMINSIVLHRKSQLLAVLPFIIRNQTFDLPTLGSFFDTIISTQTDTFDDSLCSLLMAMNQDSRFAAIKLPIRRMLALSGDYASCLAVISTPQPSFNDLMLIDRFHEADFTRLFTLVLQRIAAGHISGQAVDALGWLTYDPGKVKAVIVMLTQHLQAQPLEQTVIKIVISPMIHAACISETASPELYAFLTALFDKDLILEEIIYAITSNYSDGRSTREGIEFRMMLISALVNAVSSDGPIAILVSTLYGKSRCDINFIEESLIHLQQRFPHKDISSYMTRDIYQRDVNASVIAAVAKHYLPASPL